MVTLTLWDTRGVSWFATLTYHLASAGGVLYHCGGVCHVPAAHGGLVDAAEEVQSRGVIEGGGMDG